MPTWPNAAGGAGASYRTLVVLAAACTPTNEGATPTKEPSAVAVPIEPTPTASGAPAPPAATCRLEVRKGEEHEMAQGAGATHRAACRDAWKRVADDTAHPRLIAIDGVPLTELLTPRAGDPGPADCHLEIELRGPRLEAKGTSSTSMAEARDRAEAEACRLLALSTCDKSAYATDANLAKSLFSGGARTYSVTLHVRRLLGPSDVKGLHASAGGKDLRAACQRAYATACGSDCGTALVQSVEGVPVPRLPARRGRDRLGW